MLRLLVVFLAVLSSQVGVACAADDPVKIYADSLAKFVVENNENALYEQFAPSLRLTFSREDLVRPLSLIREKHGSISSYEYRQRIKGQTLFSGRLIGHLTYWYAVQTQNETPGAFLLVKVTEEGGRLHTAGIDFNQILGPVPSFLEAKEKQKTEQANERRP